MTPEQALNVLTALLNSPVTKLAYGVTDLAACDAALRTLREAVKAGGASAPASQPEPTREPGTAA